MSAGVYGPDAMTHTIHLHPTAELAPRVLLPGDPGRALALAQLLFDEVPRMFNHHRGLWGYTGIAGDGAPLTIQATGMGGPSAAIVVDELADLGATHVVRIGTCRSLRPELGLGRLVVATQAIARDGTSRALGAGERVAPDAGLLAALVAAAGDGAAAGPIASHDLFYGDEREPLPEQALAVDLESATVLQAAVRRELRAASILAVTDEVAGRTRIDPDGVEAAGEAVGRAGAAALLAVTGSEAAAPPRLRLV
jgi:uridine phosphorylase